MTKKSKYQLVYTLDNVEQELVLEVELVSVQGELESFQNLIEGKAKLNGRPYDTKSLSHCVNAKAAVERMGIKMRDELKVTSKQEGKRFKIIKEELK